jgi:flagellar motility protein MotE (MotC chaperone)
MWRTIALLIGLFSFATVLAEGVTLGYLAYDGRISSEAFKAALSDKSRENQAAAAPAAQPPTAEEAETTRTLQTLELNARADNLRLLKDLVTKEADRLSKDQAAYEKSRTEFETRLAEVRTRAVDEATEQARLVVKSLAPKDAIIYLLALEEEDALRLVKGLPERTVAKILQEFAAGTDEEQQRGRKLFEAIAAAQPEAKLTDAAKAALPSSTPGGSDG